MSAARGAPLVIDTSVAVKWFFDEPLADRARAVFEAGRSGARRLVVPDLIYPEFGNAVRKHVVRDALAPEDGALIVAAFTRIPFASVLACRPLLAAAYSMAVRHGCTVYDAVFLAVAAQTGADCVTADERLYRVAGASFSGLRWLGDGESVGA